MKRGKGGVAPCNIEVASWDQVPRLEVPEGERLVAQVATGTCRRCQVDMDEQLAAMPEEADEAERALALIPKRSPRISCTRIGTCQTMARGEHSCR